MISAFGIEHGDISKVYQETRVATPKDLSEGQWMTGKTKAPGKLKSLLAPKRAKKQLAASKEPFYATRDDDQLSGEKTYLSHGRLGVARDVKRFSRNVGGEYNPKGNRRY